VSISNLKKSGWTPKKGEQSLFDALQGASDVGYRGLLAGLLGSPVDTANLVQNAGREAYNQFADKPVPLSNNPIGGSEWFGQKMQDAGLVSNKRRPFMEALAGFASPDATDLLKIAPAMIAFHGSPHKFDKFDLSKIGTGEGAQVYGHGLYFADNPDVAKGYSSALGGFDVSEIDQKKAIEELRPYKFDRDVAYEILNDVDYNKEESRDHTSAIADFFLVMMQEPSQQNQAIKSLMKIGAKPTGSIYKVDIDDNAIANMLDWDKPLSEQPQSVRNWLKDPYNAYRSKLTEIDVGGQEPTGGLIMNRLQSLMSGGRKSDAFTNTANYGADVASRELADFGIPGIRYLDQASRGLGQGTKNTVLFDDSLVKILERNGEKFR
jgi:hypothetical protein